MTKLPRVVVVGGGFAGVSCLEDLIRSSVCESVLVSRSRWFEYTPALHTAIVDDSKDERIRVDLAKIFGARFVEGKAIGVKDKRLKLDSGKNLAFDYLVVATGSRTNYFGNDAWAKWALSLKTVKEARIIRSRLAQARTVTVIGGGYTGVEVASVLAGRGNWQVKLVHSRNTVLSNMDETVGRIAGKWLINHGVECCLGLRAKRIEKGLVVLESGDKLESDVTIYTAGIKPNLDFLGSEIRVRKDSLIAQTDCVYVCGDAAPQTSLTTAHNAIIEGRFVARQVIRKILGNSGKERQTRDWRLLAVALGERDGIVTWGKKGIYVPHFVGMAKVVIERVVVETFARRVRFPF